MKNAEPRLKISLERNEVAIEGNKEGLLYLRDLCEKLAGLSEGDARTPMNHYHIMSDFGNAVEGSMRAILHYNPEL